MSKYYIGLATSLHDPAMAIADKDGTILFAESLERYLQNKRAWCYHPDDLFRVNSLIQQYCADNTELVIAASWRTRYLRPAKFFVLEALHRIFARTQSYPEERFAFSNRYFGGNFIYQNSKINPKSKITLRDYDHHLTHAVTACYTSPYRNAVCVIVDGTEDNALSIYEYANEKLTLIPRFMKSTASLGFFYFNLCILCGFDPLKGEEWKVMGLAAYGKFDERYYKIFQALIQVDNCRIVKGQNYKKIVKDFFSIKAGPKDRPLDSADLAFTGQLFFCNIITQLLNNVDLLGISNNLVLSGGCILNSACNGIISTTTQFKNPYVFSAPADDGNAIGAALLAYKENNIGVERKYFSGYQTPYLGSKIELDAVDRFIKHSSLIPSKIPFGKNFLQYVAELLSKGKIIGWVQGRAEFGPRALGNRSILADPRDLNVKEKLNKTIKYREEFRPFAPAILHEYGTEYFENYEETPYMERALYFKKTVVDKIPGVVHVDGTGRLQTVKREWNEKFYDLIKAFQEITEIPILLNTSFNVMGKPIIHTFEDAISVFFTTGIDALVIEDLLFEKPHAI